MCNPTPQKKSGEPQVENQGCRCKTQICSKPGSDAEEVCLLVFVIRLTQTRVSWKEGPSMRNYLGQIDSEHV